MRSTPLRINQSASITASLAQRTYSLTYAKALRTTGLLVARRPPSPPALIARRRAWVEMDKMILFMSDNDLAECVMAKSRGEQPEEILDAQLDELLTSLAP
jgi:hypothetical protein